MNLFSSIYYFSYLCLIMLATVHRLGLAGKKLYVPYSLKCVECCGRSLVLELSFVNRPIMGEVGKLKILLEDELKRLKDMCNDWENELKHGVSIPENVTELIRCAIGKATLLVNGKLKQFNGLITSSESSTEDNRITPSDLQGFWDLICIEISGIDKSFCDLNLLKKNAWTENEENSWESKESDNTHVGKVKNTKRTAKKTLTVNSYKNIPPRKRLADIKKEMKASRDMKTDEKDTVLFEVPAFFSVRSPAKVKKGASSIRSAEK
ncbi:hypothetical protein J437_LFUL009803 [Ladona fulva]|uniref:Uncharacterized protein n=1 Tax=Ladona fulva TaxID=123851 RepID=A0A8K0JZI3_LADFU|nr:hypothetical protein J437_LFUL009803 [Ladona fulva]